MWIFIQVLWDRGTKRGGRGAAAQDGERRSVERAGPIHIANATSSKAVLEERFCGVWGLRDPGDVWSGGTFRCGRCSEMSRWQFPCHGRCSEISIAREL